MGKTRWVKITETRGKMWTIETYHRAYGGFSKYMRKEVSTPTKLNKEGKREVRYFKTI